MTPADCANLSNCSMTADPGTTDSDLQTISRTLAARGADYLSVEDFGCVGNGMADDRAALQKALNWSAKVGRAVYASRNYFLLDALTAKANTTLLATPSARFIRAFGLEDPNTGGPMLLSLGTGDQPNIRIAGGVWGPDPVQKRPASMTFTNVDSSGSNTVTFAGAKALLFDAGGNLLPNIARRLWVYQRDPKGDYDPSIPNNNKIFTVVEPLSDTTLRLGEAPVATTTPITGMIASQVPLAGPCFNINSTGGVIDGVGLVFPRGNQFLLQGDNFLLTRSWSRDPTPDAGGGVRFARGRGMRGTLLDLETSDDCFQFTPAPGQTVERSSYSDCIGRTNQGALIAFANGGGNTFTPDPSSGPSNDSNSLLRDCLARNIRGVTGGSDRVGVGIKMDCANPSHATTNCWVEDSFIGQSSRLDRVAPPCAFVALA